MRSTITRICTLLLTLTMLLPCFCSCGFDEDYTGPILKVTLADTPTTFDPARAYLDENALQLLSLIYEGLFSYDKNGKLVNAVADSWKWIKQDAEKNDYELEIYLKKTAWNDGQTVTADQFVYAWRRILDPAFPSEAACLLYDVKNARKVKSGDCSIFDFGATAEDTDVIRIAFDHPVDTNQFFALLASPALVPVRDDVVEKNGLVDWASTSAIIASNGPFYLKSYSVGNILRLERNRNYYRDVEKDAMDKYVTPYRLEVNFNKNHIITGLPLVMEGEKAVLQTPAENLMIDPATGFPTSEGDGIKPILETDTTAMTGTLTYYFSSVDALNEYLWESEQCRYYSNIPLQYREKYRGEVTELSRKATSVLFFNEKNAVLAKPQVRKALSLAIDRTALAAALQNAVVPAEGLIPAGVLNTGLKTDFRSVGGSLIASAADVNAAKALLKEAGVSSGSFELSIRYSDPDALTIANALIDAWKQIGFTVTLRAYETDVTGKPTQNSYKIYDEKEKGYDGLIKDYYIEAYLAGDFDVMLGDVCQLTTDAFSTLAPFATAFCGGSIDLSLSEEELANVVTTHVTGYQSEAYDALIEKAFAEQGRTDARAEALHEAEKMLLDEAVVAPLFTYKTAYVVSDNLKKLSDNWFGTTVFTKVSDKTYVYVPEEG